MMQLLAGHDQPIVPMKLKRTVEKETDSYIRERIYYQTLPGVYVPAFLITPKNVSSPAPAVLCPPGHGSGMNQVMDEENGLYKQYPLELVERGMVVLVPEHAGFGERCIAEGEDAKYASHGYFYLSVNLLGESQMGYLLWDLRRAIDLLQSLPQVDPNRIGCYGLSLGGEMTLFTAAADRRIKAACISGFLCSYKSSFLDQGHCGCGYVYGLAKYLEHADIAALIAPRPLLIESATEDPIFPVNVARRTYRELKKTYGLFDAKDRIAQDVFEGSHEISGAKAYDWFAKWLYGGR